MIRLCAQDRARLPSGGYPEGVGAAAMAATPTLLYVADSRGHVHTLRCELRGGALHGLVHLARRWGIKDSMARMFCPCVYWQAINWSCRVCAASSATALCMG